MKYFFITISLLLVSLVSFSQVSEQLQEQINDAEYFYWNEDYAQALPLYKEVLKQDPDNANMNYKAGRCYQLMPFEAGRSINYLEKAVKSISRIITEGSYQERNAPVDALYFLAQAYHNNKYYEEALEMYSRFRDSLDVEDTYNINIVERQLQSCKSAQEIAKNPVSVEIWNVGNVVNTAYADFNPCVTADGKTMFFNRKIPIENDGDVTGHTIRIYTANRLDEERWSKPEDITDQLGTKGVCVVVSVNATGTMLILNKNPELSGSITDVKGGSLYYSKKEYRTDQAWPQIQLFDKIINSKANETHASISPDGKKLYFTSDRKGGFGGLDIYVTEILPDGKWSIPRNLGPVINSPFDEDTPFILEDNKTLYFASEGHYNMGGFDVFSAKLTEHGVWSQPINLGAPINSPEDNLFFAPALGGKQAYYAQARNEGYFTFGDEDIYELNMLSHDEYVQGIDVTIKGELTFDDGTPADGSTKVIISKGDQIIDTVSLDEKGKYKVKLPSGEYTFKFTREKYNAITKVVSIEKSLVEKTIAINASLYPEVGDSKKYYVIRNIYFDDNENTLNREAIIEVEKLKNVMLENPSLYIEVIGHTDSRGSAQDNKKLSMQRSRAVIDYLVSKGVEQKRFVSTAAGEGKALVADVTPEGTTIEAAAKLNRRVEIRILKTIDGAEIIVDNTPAEIALAKFNRFSVQLIESDKDVDLTTFKNLGQDYKVMKAMIKPNTYIYYFGDYKTKAEAVKNMNSAISKGYKSAKIVDYFELNKDNEFLITNPVPFKKSYTIQLQALAKQQIITTNPILIEAAKYKTEDGFYRYTYKEYASTEEAQNDLMELWDSGFPNAFIVEVKDLKQ